MKIGKIKRQTVRDSWGDYFTNITMIVLGFRFTIICYLMAKLPYYIPGIDQHNYLPVIDTESRTVYLYTQIKGFYGNKNYKYWFDTIKAKRKAKRIGLVKSAQDVFAIKRFREYIKKARGFIN